MNLKITFKFFNSKTQHTRQQPNINLLLQGRWRSRCTQPYSWQELSKRLFLEACKNGFDKEIKKIFKKKVDNWKFFNFGVKNSGRAYTLSQKDDNWKISTLIVLKKIEMQLYPPPCLW